MISNSELATALAFVLQKWKDTGADSAETKPFDDLLERAKDEAPLPAAPVQIPVRYAETGPHPKRAVHFADEAKIAFLDAEIEAANREATEE